MAGVDGARAPGGSSDKALSQGALLLQVAPGMAGRVPIASGWP